MDLFQSDLTFRIQHRVVRSLPSLFTNKPFLSGDNISSLTELVLPAQRKLWDQKKIEGAKSIFVNTEYLNDLLLRLSEDSKCEYIVAGNSDFEYRIKQEYEARNIRKVFVQNSFVANSAVYETLPIGVENIRHSRNGFKHTLKNRPLGFRDDRILVGPFGPTNDERTELLRLYSNHDQDFMTQRESVNPLKFARLQRQFKFTLCPKGNGRDTHRIWESIYRGSWPIVEKDSWSESIAENYPIILVENLLDVESLKSLRQDKNYSAAPELRSNLFLPHWKRLLTKE